MRRNTTLLAALLLASCGGSRLPQPAPAPHPEAAAVSTSNPETPVPAVEPKASIDVGPSKMVADVQALGIDLSNPGELPAIERARKIRVMQFFVRALGTTCEGCHVPGDPKADTRNKQIARAMWKNFVGALRDPNGQPIFCDSCHQGRQKILAREDDKVLAKWMKANYVEHLSRADQTEHGCATCHGKPFETDIFKNRFHVTL
jgi:hypothetical protein